VRVVSPQDDGKLEPEALNDTDRLELSVHVNEKHRHVVLSLASIISVKGGQGRRCRTSAYAWFARGRRTAGNGACLDCRTVVRPIFRFDGVTPIVAEDAFIAPTAAVIAMSLSVGDGDLVPLSCARRPDSIRIGARTNIQTER